MLKLFTIAILFSASVFTQAQYLTQAPVTLIDPVPPDPEFTVTFVSMSGSSCSMKIEQYSRQYWLSGWATECAPLRTGSVIRGKIVEERASIFSYPYNSFYIFSHTDKHFRKKYGRVFHVDSISQ